MSHSSGSVLLLAKRWRTRLGLFGSSQLARATTRAIGSRRGYWKNVAGKHVDGACNVCGRATRFFYEDLRTARESLVCRHCGSTSRYRSIARGVLDAIAELRGIECDALARLPARLDVPVFRVLDTQVPFYARSSAYPVPDLLRRCTWTDVLCSIHRPDLPIGLRLGRRVSNQDLERLTYADGSFDLVITSDVLEHVRLDALAHQEIARVLGPGGVYLFTVPHGRGIARTIERVVVHDPEDPTRDEFAMAPEYHGDTNSRSGRALAYRVYGLDLDAALESLGFAVSYEKKDDERRGIVNTELFYCRKRS